MLLGEPSPALAKIALMNIAALEAKLESLKEEQERLARRIERLEKQDPQPAEQIENLKTQVIRLQAIEKAAKDRLEVKLERRAQWEAKQQGLGGD
jgi:cell division protein FtsB